MTEQNSATQRHIAAEAVYDLLDYAQHLIDSMDYDPEDVSADYISKRNLISIMRRRAQTLYED